MTNIIDGFKEFWGSAFRWPVMIVIAAAFLTGIIISGGSAVESGHEGHNHASGDAAAAKVEDWTCSMHPQIRQPKPGKCPICGMDLIPVSTGDDGDAGPRELKLSPTAIKLAGIQTAPVERRFVETEIRMVGKITHDESKLGYITSRMPGRIDRLYVDYTGIQVRKGDHLVSLYSPELISAQQELLQALKSYKKYGSGRATLNAAREKLKLWGLKPEQIRNIEQKGTTTHHLTIYSPMAGIVIRKKAVEGMYVKTGTPIYTIADLSRVWVKMDAYESDISWLRYGQKVEFETEAYPGDVFNGKIAFIDPVLDPKTRTVKIRVNVINKDLKLKPEMFVHAVVRSKVSVTGKVMDPELAGKWISPMHPEIVKDKPGACDVCGMALVKAEKLGYIDASKKMGEAPLVIPSSAPLITGTRAVVYVAKKGKDGVFEGKNVILGPRAGNYYLIKKGLEEGEQVVVNGAFKIDSDLQIQAKPSMMNPEGIEPAPGHQHGAMESPAPDPHKGHKNEKIKTFEAPTAFKTSIDAVADGYFKIQHALSSDNLTDARKGNTLLLKKLSVVDMKLLKGEAHLEWMKQEKVIAEAAKALANTGDIEAARQQLEVMTAPMTELIKAFGSGKSGVWLYHCPMAFDNKGAYWLQNNPDTRNPYFGDAMLTCKDSVEPLVNAKK